MTSDSDIILKYLDRMQSLGVNILPPIERKLFNNKFKCLGLGYQLEFFYSLCNGMKQYSADPRSEIHLSSLQAIKLNNETVLKSYPSNIIDNFNVIGNHLACSSFIISAKSFEKNTVDKQKIYFLYPDGPYLLVESFYSFLERALEGDDFL